MGILNWLRRPEAGAHRHNKQEVAELTERVLGLSPRLRLVPRYEKRLGPKVGIALDYARDLIASLPAPREASVAAWDSDPYIHAFFGAAHDVELAFSRSSDLREFFEAAAHAQEAYAVLGMAMTERRTLGVALQGDVMRVDVPQTTISFSDHQVRICARTDSALREEIARRMLDQLALQGLANIAADRTRRDVLERELGLLKTRLRLLERQGAGMRSVLCGEGETDLGERARLREQIEQNGRELGELGEQSGALERQLEALAEVFADARSCISIDRGRLRLSRMNVLLPEASASPGDDLELLTARVRGDPPLVRTFALVRFARAAMLSPMRLLDEAERLL
ncbi:hypothetical protein [Cupriavidus basilensis]|uniref:hypothetical protein n=1 Tax=Cupriavidus basilensis TaxID=68895 RepID=UPI00157B3342|nr:hypothetical protein [Cupriavidus basilensis]NUA28640.1 hypothetical protein [Cupriavidus basilensis]